MSSTNNITGPFLTLQDVSGDTGTLPLQELVGGLNAASLGLEITSTAGTAGTALPPLSTIMGQGYGGLSLVQLGLASSTAGVSSPVLTMCAQQYGTAGSGGAGTDCWSWQVQGGAGTGTGSGPPDILALTRSTSTNGTSNITVLFPPSINLATAPNPSGLAGQITVGPQPIIGPNANVPSTLTGASTSNSSASSVAGPVTVEPGQLTNASPAAGAVEGALQILQSYLGSNGTSNVNVGRLACPSGTAQSVVPCTVAGQAENWVGVYNTIPGQAGTTATVTPLRYGRVVVASSSAVSPWTNGDFVCKDDASASYSRDNSATPCSSGESIGIAVGDPGSGSTSTHLVDLVPEASVTGGAVMTFFCTGFVSAGQSNYLFPSALGTNCQQAVVAAAMQPVSFSGTLKNLEVVYGTAPGTSHTDTFTVFKCPALAACSATTVKCQVSGTAISCSDIADTVAVSQGDGIQIVDAAGTSSAAQAARVTIQIQ